MDRKKIDLVPSQRKSINLGCKAGNLIERLNAFTSLYIHSPKVFSNPSLTNKISLPASHSYRQLLSREGSLLCHNCCDTGPQIWKSPLTELPPPPPPPPPHLIPSLITSKRTCLIAYWWPNGFSKDSIDIDIKKSICFVISSTA